MCIRDRPTSVLSAGAAPEKAAAALIDKDSAVELYAGFGKHVYTCLLYTSRAVESAESTDPEISSAFIEMAAHLVEMKSYLLLPRSEEGAVSYTHLDVYKRQGLRSAGGCKPGVYRRDHSLPCAFRPRRTVNRLK